MKRRSKIGGQRPKPQRPDASKLKHRSAENATRGPTSVARHQEQIVRLTRELDEAREQQTATSEVLRAVSQSEFQLQSVLQSVAESAAKLCRSDGAVIFQLQEGVYRFAAGYSLLPEFLEIEPQALISPGLGTLIGRAAMTGRVARIDDALADPLYEKKEEGKVEGNRSMMGVPLMREGKPVVVIGMGRHRLDPFGERQIELAKSFAAQAVIAIENARLLNELRQRTTDLSEALEQQTATSDVLQVISGALRASLSRSSERCRKSCSYLRREFWKHLTAGTAKPGIPCSATTYNTPPRPICRNTEDVSPITDLIRRMGSVECLRQKDRFASPTVRLEASYVERRDPSYVAAVELVELWRSAQLASAVPMLKEGELIGGLSPFEQAGGSAPSMTRRTGLVAKLCGPSCHSD